jgi:hypothetical protein
MKFRPGVRRVRRCLGLVVTLTSAAGCAPAPSHTVEEYRHDAKLRELTFARCAEDPVSRDLKPNCVNAREAERLEGVGSLRKLTPLELPNPPQPDSSAQDFKARN